MSQIAKNPIGMDGGWNWKRPEVVYPFYLRHAIARPKCLRLASVGFITRKKEFRLYE